MISSILSVEKLREIMRHEVSENSVFVKLDHDFYCEDGCLNNDKIINLSVDSYYNSLRMPSTPPSPDNLLVIRRGENKYSIYIIELKDVARVSRLDHENIRCKYTTAVDDFMSDRFRECFIKDGSKVTDFNVWIVCNRFSFLGADLSDEEYEKKVLKGGVMEKLLLSKPYKFGGKISPITFQLSGTEVC
ncbi:hypothetical protein [Enterobacter sp. ECC-249]|uniref:hypothetical protein n=1 Tax=Enterobacter TaxID=547 RepID=UPI003754DBC9